MGIKEVFVPANYAPLGKKRPGYFVRTEDKTLHSIKWGFLHQLSPYQGRYHISNNGEGEWVPRQAIARAKRSPATPMFHRVPKAA